MWLSLLRGSLWFFAQLIVVTLLVFTSTGRSARVDSVPLFLNSEPVFVSTRAWQLVETIGRNAPDKPRATAELLRLGGAALPHVLPKLDSLEPAARQELLRALAPLAVRMQLTPALPTAEESEALWLSFWNDHFVDFHSAMARRVVRRFALGPTAPRAQEVRRLDTFALGELIRELNRLAREKSPVETAKPVVELLCSIATEPGTPCAAPQPVETRAIADSWRGWWQREHHRFEAPNGAERFLSPILQTEYADWVRSSARAVLSGRGLRSFPWRACLLTTIQFVLAIACAMWTAGALQSHGAPRRRWARVVAWPLLTVPAVLWFGLGEWAQALGYGGLGALSGVAMGAWAHCYARAFGAPGSGLRAVYPHVSHVLGVVLVGEALSHADGLGDHLALALRSRELQSSVWTALGCAVLIAFGHALTSAAGSRAAGQRSHTP